jgi:membrane associated rhomboid family serine protease
VVLPLYDDNSDRRIVPIVNYILIGINVLVFALFQQFGQNDHFTYAFSTVPEEIRTGHDIVTDGEVAEDPLTGEKVRLPGLEPTPLTPYITLLTSMFMHGGLMHLLGNMLFLWIFGDNVEDFLGHIRYLIFYLVCGLLASLAHVFSTLALGQNTMVPSLGASGAISGVLGGYIVLHPHRRVTVILFRILTQVPAWVAIGLWFVFQLIASAGALGSEGAGVAYGAHIGGFIAGLALVKLFALGISPVASGQSYPPRRFQRRR